MILQDFCSLLQIATGKQTLLSHVLSDEEWKNMYHLAKKQALLGIAFEGVKKLPQEQWPTGDIVLTWTTATEGVKRRNMRTTDVCLRLTKELAKEGFEVCILKGQANHVYYDRLSSEQSLGMLRVCGDVDAWIWPKEEVKHPVRTIINYCKHNNILVSLCHLHAEVKPVCGVPIEIHFRPSFLNAPWRNRCFQKLFQIVKREDIDEQGNYSGQDIIPFWSLSSGERQIAYIISNFVYHVVNINSVHYNNVDVVAKLPLLKYKYINVIFDEIELYFHPDLQRRFLFLIVEALKSIHIEHIEGINILLVTHSPFVLSDLPKSNVLALSSTNEEVVGETFCANIQEMLGQSFFMEYSMGKIAQEQIEEIFRAYNHIEGNENVEISEEDWQRFSYVTSIVGDEYLHTSLSRVLKILENYRNRRDEQ